MKIDLSNLGNYQVPDIVKNGVCVDIGANVGNFFKKYNNFFSLIHFYEPTRECFEICMTNKYNNVFGFNEAVSNKNGISSLIMHHTKDAGSVAITDSPYNEEWDREHIIQQTITTVDLETVIKRIDKKIDYLKCDAENSEYNIFIDKDISNISFIGIELHHQMGEELYTKLLKHFLLTHEIFGDYQYLKGYNKECLLINKVNF